MGLLLPSQRYKLAKAYDDIAKIYREARHLQAFPPLDDAARIAEMIADSFRRNINVQVSWKSHASRQL